MGISHSEIDWYEFIVCMALELWIVLTNFVFLHQKYMIDFLLWISLQIVQALKLYEFYFYPFLIITVQYYTLSCSTVSDFLFLFSLVIYQPDIWITLLELSNMVVYRLHDISWFQYLHGHNCILNPPSALLSQLVILLLRDIRILSSSLQDQTWES